jgi:hypothetical protein
MCDWPTTVLKFWGRYLRAETMNLSIIKRDKFKEIIPKPLVLQSNKIKKKM